MSRIDEALKRLSGGGTPETRVPQMLERYASESPGVVEEPVAKAPPREDDHKIATFVTPATRRQPELRSSASSPESRSAPRQPTPPAPPVRSSRPRPSTQSDREVESEPLIEVRQLVNYVGFVWRAVLRHKLMVATTMVLLVALTTAVLLLLPKTYHVQTTLFAQRNAVMTALSNPGRAVPWDADAPTRAAAETVLRRDNLISLIHKTDLLNEWDRTRAPVLKLKDSLVAFATRHTPTAEEKLEGLIARLETSMVVNAGPVGDGTVTIDLHWPDAEVGYRLVQSAHDAFVEARQVAETAAIGESIAILERYSASLHQDIDRTLAELHRIEQSSTRAPARRRRLIPQIQVPPAATAAASSASPSAESGLEVNEDLLRLRTALTNKRQELARLEETRQRQMAEVETRLEQLRTTYTAGHPSVLATQQMLASASQESPQMNRLTAEVDELQAEYDKQLNDLTSREVAAVLSRPAAQDPTTTSATPTAPAAPQFTEEFVEPVPATPRSAPDVQFATLRLSTELSQLRSVVERTDAARIELAVSQAAFKYRYTVIRPAQIPKEPVFPKIRQTFAAGLFMSVFLAVGLAVLKDLLSRRVFERWQVERQLGLAVLGTLRRS